MANSPLLPWVGSKDYRREQFAICGHFFFKWGINIKQYMEISFLVLCDLAKLLRVANGKLNGHNFHPHQQPVC